MPDSFVHGISWQEYWSGLPFPSPGDLDDPGTEPTSPAWQADSLPLSQRGTPNHYSYTECNIAPKVLHDVHSNSALAYKCICMCNYLKVLT